MKGGITDFPNDGEFYNERDVAAAECVRYTVSAVRNYCVSQPQMWLGSGISQYCKFLATSGGQLKCFLFEI